MSRPRQSSHTSLGFLCLLHRMTIKTGRPSLFRQSLNQSPRLRKKTALQDSKRVSLVLLQRSVPLARLTNLLLPRVRPIPIPPSSRNKCHRNPLRRRVNRNRKRSHFSLNVLLTLRLTPRHPPLRPVPQRLLLPEVSICPRWRKAKVLQRSKELWSRSRQPPRSRIRRHLIQQAVLSNVVSFSQQQQQPPPRPPPRSKIPLGYPSRSRQKMTMTTTTKTMTRIHWPSIVRAPKTSMILMTLFSLVKLLLNTTDGMRTRPSIGIPVTLLMKKRMIMVAARVQPHAWARA
ncbi:hypothetical protein I309_01331 [Cryptococcus deuterogattii LA55]|nr:hypothetical protein I309_01331 [Cryptococcus deuterogattii LA55]KIR95595.1 hypothetical protein I304_00348 [Cryptococcus deuterogattii CBS 10090]